jgi:hypothetical protein
MPYKINGTDLTLQPESGQWVTREKYGVDGSGHSVVPRLRKFELSWGFVSMSEYQQIENFYSTVSVTGTAVVTLPQWNASAYQFYDYSGCVIQPPEQGVFFEEYVSNVRLIISNIAT